MNRCKIKRNTLRKSLKLNQIYLKIGTQEVFGVADYRSSFYRFKKFKTEVEVYKKYSDLLNRHIGSLKVYEHFLKPDSCSARKHLKPSYLQNPFRALLSITPNVTQTFQINLFSKLSAMSWAQTSTLSLILYILYALLFI